jgi:hypothetical protein
MAERRTLSFASLDRVMPDVDALLEGHRTVGNWTLGQICNHLTIWIQGSIDGFPLMAPWVVRKTIGPIALRKILKDGRIGTGIKVQDVYLPKSDLDDRAEAEALRAALTFFSAHNATFAQHPFFGVLSRDDWTRLHGIHCAHHLSFVWPNAPA